MDQRVRINETTTPTTSFRRNDVYRQFAPAFNAIFSAHPLSIDHFDGNAGYVENAAIEDRLRHFVQTSFSHLNHIIGETGIGKSTYIRKVFGASPNPTIVGNIMYIPFYCNGKDINEFNYIDRFKSQLQAAYKLCRKTFENISKLDFVDIYKFVSQHNAALLESGDFFDELDEKEALQSLLRNNPYAFYAELLKYTCERTYLDHVVIIYDDIESIIDNRVLVKYVGQACRFHTCFLNAPARSFSVTSIMALRPTTRRMLEDEDWYTAFTPNDTLSIVDPVGLRDIFNARFDYLLSEDLKGHYKDTDRLIEALEILKKLVDRFEVRTLTLITELSNHNIRVALRAMSSVLSNRRFIQGGVNPREHFVVRFGDYLLNGGTIFNSLVMEESDVYFDHNPHVFNIFKNGESPETDLILSYICKYFYHRNSKSWSKLEKINKIDLFEDLGILCEDRPFLDYLLKYLETEHVIERHEIKGKGELSETVFVAMPRLFGVLNMLEVNSVLFDALRDDTYLTSDFLRVDGRVEPIARTADPKNKYTATLLAWEAMICAEEYLINKIQPSERLSFRRKYGSATISKMIGLGIKTTRSATDAAHNGKYSELSARVDRLEGGH